MMVRTPQLIAKEMAPMIAMVAVYILLVALGEGFTL